MKQASRNILFETLNRRRKHQPILNLNNKECKSDNINIHVITGECFSGPLSIPRQGKASANRRGKSTPGNAEHGII
jgi:hypothetical protein